MYERNAMLSDSALTRFDHQIAAETVTAVLNLNAEIELNLRIIDAGQQESIDDYNELSLVGAYLIPLGVDNRQSHDTDAYAAYLAGMCLALETLDALCATQGIDETYFRKIWKQVGRTQLLDLKDDRLKDCSASEAWQTVASGILAVGDKHLLSVHEDTYTELLDLLSRAKPQYAANPYVLNSSFGYVLEGGVRALNVILKKRIETEFDNSDPDSELSAFLKELPDRRHDEYEDAEHAFQETDDIDEELRRLLGD